MMALAMAEGTFIVSSESDSSGEHTGSEEGEGAPLAIDGLSAAQREVLERCLHTLTHAKNDSHTLAALLLITRLCPAGQLDSATLRRIFEAVGLSLPARLLVTAVRGSDASGLPPEELLSLGTALLAALSTDPDMAAHPQLLTTIPLLLGLLADGPKWSPQKQAQHQARQGMEPDQPSQAEDEQSSQSTNTTKEPVQDTAGFKAPSQDATSPTGSEEGTAENGAPNSHSTVKLDEALATDCYQVLNTVCALPRGPDQLLARGAVPALCRALGQKQTLSHEKGLPLLGALLSGKTKERAWSKHPAELLSLLARVSQDFCQATGLTQLDMCALVPQFLPSPGGTPKDTDLTPTMVSLWAALRPMLQAKLTPGQIGPVLVLSACLLDLCGWEPVGPPKFCCLLVNRACVEVRMGLEEPPDTELSPQLQQTLTACYRVMEAAMEQACSSQGVAQQSDAQPQTAITGLSLQQSRQVLRVLEEAFSAVIYHLQQVDPSRYGDPFIFATFRSLCAWLAEETSCLKEEVIALLPFLMGYARSHLQGESHDQGLSNWMSEMSVGDCSQGGAWTGKDAVRYLLPALCHLSAEDAPRKVLLTLDTPGLLVTFLTQGWGDLRGKGGAALARDPSMETACSALLNFTVTEPERVRKDPCFRSLESLLSEALPVLLHKPRLLVLAANLCTLGLMIGRLKPAPKAPVEASQRRFFSAALRFLRGALDSSSGPGPVRVSPAWEEWWEEAGELWRLGLQALGGCVKAQPWIITLVREEGWLNHTLAMLGSCSTLPDPHTQGALEEALCAVALQCPFCRQEISVLLKSSAKGALGSMDSLRKSLTTN
ncbi:neurochondrin [Oncorhynchus tshawytscha]|uniref:Neurochondrin n=1 Tax=Oncorhynchus tshawytscha TaxID=74940 RepID=A0A8C8HEG8_ONCTS|nr:neurochondrin [Oncorhynchus tshawytscha]XP_024251815.1 neurochondrin [Oncorhynchus tshawytscha]